VLILGNFFKILVQYYKIEQLKAVKIYFVRKHVYKKGKIVKK